MLSTPILASPSPAGGRGVGVRAFDEPLMAMGKKSLFCSPASTRPSLFLQPPSPPTGFAPLASLSPLAGEGSYFQGRI